MNKKEKRKWERVADLVSKELKQEFSCLLKKKINLEQNKKKLQRELDKTELSSERVAKEIADICQGIDGKKCPHPESYRTGTGGHFCYICGDMTDYD